MSEWETVTADIFCLSVRDGTHDSPKPVARGRRLITSRHITGGRLDFSNSYLISDSDFSAINLRSKVHQWDVLISMIGTVGEACLISDEPDFAIKNIGLFKSRGELEGKWLYYYLRSPIAQQFIRERSAGTTQAYIPLGELRKLPVTLPTKRAAMQAIIAILRALDDKIELNRRMNETLEAMARAIFQDWFVAFGPTRAKMEGRPPYLAPGLWALFPDRLDAEGKPEGWVYRALGQVAAIDWGNTSLTKRVYVSHGFPAFSAAGQDGHVAVPEREGLGTVISAIGTVGKLYLAHGRWTAIKNTITAQANTDPLSAFVHFSLAHTEIPTRGSTQQFIALGDARAVKILVPSANLVASFGDAVLPCLMRVFANYDEVLTLSATRDLLLPRLMSGELRVKDAERAVETAA